MEYRNQQRPSGWGRLLSRDQSESVTVFFVLRTAEVYAGSKDPIRMPDLLDVVEMDYRSEDKRQKVKAPEWVWRDSTLETEDGKSYRVRRRIGFWEIGILPVSSQSEVEA